MVRLATLAIPCALLAAMQTSDLSEIRVTSQPYVPQAPFTLRVDTRLVEVGVVVRDGQGHAVSGLTKDNFRVRDNGKEREIAGFEAESAGLTMTASRSESKSSGTSSNTAPSLTPARPRFVALYFDDINAKDGQDANDLKQAQDAAQRFVREALQPGVRMAVFTASGEKDLDFTTDSTKLTAAIGSLRPHTWLSESGIARCPKVSPYLAYMIAVRHDPQASAEAAYETAGDIMCKNTPTEAITDQAQNTWLQAHALAKQTLESIDAVTGRLGSMPGSRLLLLTSSGFYTATLEQETDQVINRALRSGVVISALDAKGLVGDSATIASTPLSGPGVPAGLGSRNFNVISFGLRADAMDEPLAALDEGTGGRFFHNSNDLHAGFEQLATPAETTYRLSLSASDVPTDGRYHRLKITIVGARHESVQARPGYFAPTEKAAREEMPSKFDREITAKDTVADFPIGISAQKDSLPDGETSISVMVNININSLSFTPHGDRRAQKIRFATALRDARGAIVSAKEATLDLALKKNTYDRLAKTGLNAKLTLPVTPGVYDLREVVEEADGKMACSTHSIRIR